jgi:hypothetical protein
VCGTIDIEKALSEGVKAFEPGLLAKANRGILYVDEVGSERTLCCIAQTVCCHCDFTALCTLCCIAQTVLHHAARDALLCICIPDMHRG